MLSHLPACTLSLGGTEAWIVSTDLWHSFLGNPLPFPGLSAPGLLLAGQNSATMMPGVEWGHTDSTLRSASEWVKGPGQGAAMVACG